MLQYRFKPNYKVWVNHGEEWQNENKLGYASTNYGNMNIVHEFGSVTQMVYDSYIQESFDNESMYEGEAHNGKAQRFYDMLVQQINQFMMEQPSQDY